MPTAGSSTLRYWMPLLVPLRRNSTLSSKSLTVPPRQMRKLLSLTTFSGVVSPTIEPFSARQNVWSPSQPARVLPSKIGTKPATSSGSVSGKRPPPPRPWPAGAGGWGCCPAAGSCSSPKITRAVAHVSLLTRPPSPIDRRILLRAVPLSTSGGTCAAPDARRRFAGVFRPVYVLWASRVLPGDATSVWRPPDDRVWSRGRFVGIFRLPFV